MTGLLVVGLALLGVAVGFYALTKRCNGIDRFRIWGSLISVFARLGGGIYTKDTQMLVQILLETSSVGIPERMIHGTRGDCRTTSETMLVTAQEWQQIYLRPMRLRRLRFMLFCDLVCLGARKPFFFRWFLVGYPLLQPIIGLFFIKLGASKNIVGALYK